MLRKLMKYDLRAMGRVLLPVWAGAVLLALVMLGLQFLPTWFPALLTGSYRMTLSLLYSLTILAVVLAVTIVCVVVNLLRTYGMLGQAAYLMFSLPATTGQLMLSRFLCAVGSTAVSMGLTVGLLAALTATAPAVQLHANGSDILILPVGETAPAFWGLFVLLCAGLCFAYTVVLACVAIGGQWPQQRLGATVVCYLGLSYGQGILSFALIFGLFLAAEVGGRDLVTQFSAWMSRHLYTGIGLFACGLALLFALLGGILWVVAHRLLSRRLNLA